MFLNNLYLVYLFPACNHLEFLFIHYELLPSFYFCFCPLSLKGLAFQSYFKLVYFDHHTILKNLDVF